MIVRVEVHVGLELLNFMNYSQEWFIDFVVKSLDAKNLNKFQICMFNI